MSSGESRELGRALGRLLKAGDLIALYGDLGSGKTVLAQGISTGLGYDGYVSSPSFVIVNEYAGRVPILHVDLYRIHNPAEIEDLGYRELFFGDGVAIIEWAERAQELLPDERLDIRISIDAPDRRTITLDAHGDRHIRVTDAVMELWRDRSEDAASHD
jgi:tRNA threonylcarbamoyladenosine biosynthesis protein TsaE